MGIATERIYMFLFLNLINVLWAYYYYKQTEDLTSSLIVLAIGFALCFLPATIHFIKNKYNKKWLTVSIGAAGIILALLFLSGSFIMICLDSVFDEKPITPKVQDYSSAIFGLTDKLYRIEHFPGKIPVNARNYYFHIGTNFDGYNISYLKFDINSSYIDNLLADYKDKIYKKIEYSQIDKEYRYLNSTFDIYDKENYQVFILKNEENDDDYTSGFVISKQKDRIIFFYANYDLRMPDYLKND